jgi:hypothetical protein
MSLINSLRIRPVESNGSELSVELYFDDKALMDGKPNHVPYGDAGFTPILIDQG